jgi:hypothetical protein
VSLKWQGCVTYMEEIWHLNGRDISFKLKGYVT